MRINKYSSVRWLSLIGSTLWGSYTNEKFSRLSDNGEKICKYAFGWTWATRSFSGLDILIYSSHVQYELARRLFMEVKIKGRVNNFARIKVIYRLLLRRVFLIYGFFRCANK